MRIGYVKGLNILKDEELYKNKCKELNVDRIFADKHNEKTALRDMLKYAMKGDIIIVSDALLLSKNAGEFIEIILDLSRRNICLICKNQNIDTSTAIWQNIISALLSFGNKEVISQRNTRLSEELDMFTMYLNYDDAKAYKVKFGKYLKEYQWEDLLVKVYIRCCK